MPNPPKGCLPTMSAGNLPGDVEIADSELFFIFSMF